VLERFDLLAKVPVAGLAKQNEELFVPNQSQPILLPRHSQALYLVQRVRDEAHRFAITSHRKRRTKSGLASRLDAIPGVGPVRRKALLSHFGSIDKMKEASLEELESVEGISANVAAAVKAYLE
jgi:excinuclease ABC subunit C